MHNPFERRISTVCDYIRSHPDEQLQLAELADRAGLSRFHFQRSFKAVVGLSPRQFVEASRLELGFPHDFLMSRNVKKAFWGHTFDQVDRVRPSAYVDPHRLAR